LQSISAKERYRDQIKVVVGEREKALGAAERDADVFVKTIDGLTENVTKIENSVKSIGTIETKRKAEIAKLQEKIRSLKAKVNEAPIEFNPAEWNERCVSLPLSFSSALTDCISTRKNGRFGLSTPKS
jgi:phage shock protein A